MMPRGGKRKGAGRKPAPFKRRAIRISCSDEEMQQIIGAVPDPRQRALILLQAAVVSRRQLIEAEGGK